MSREIKYDRSKCKCCPKMISHSGLGYNSHMMAHVRKGQAKRYLAYGHWAYMPINQQPPTA